MTTIITLILVFLHSFSIIMSVMWLITIWAVLEKKKLKFNLTFVDVIQFSFYILSLYSWKL